MRSLALAIVVALGVGCTGDGTGGTAGEGAGEGGSQLADVPLRQAEAPDGLVERARGTGPVDTLREVLPPRRTAPGLPPVPGELQRSFAGGYQRLFARGPRSAASSALRFVDSRWSDRFMELLGGIHDATVADGGLLPAPGLGEEGYAWEHVVPGGQSAGAVWRRGDLVLTLVLSGPIGEAAPDDVLALAGRVDGRLG